MIGTQLIDRTVPVAPMAHPPVAFTRADGVPRADDADAMGLTEFRSWLIAVADAFATSRKRIGNADLSRHDDATVLIVDYVLPTSATVASKRLDMALLRALRHAGVLVPGCTPTIYSSVRRVCHRVKRGGVKEIPHIRIRIWHRPTALTEGARRWRRVA